MSSTRFPSLLVTTCPSKPGLSISGLTPSHTFSPSTCTCAALRFPSIATEVLSSEVWAIVETSLNPSYDLMKPFWESVLGPVPSQQSLTLTSPPATTNNGPEDMDIDLFPPVPSDSAPPPPSSSASPSSESTPLSPSPTSTAEEITVETGDDDDEFEGEPGSTAKEERHADFHKVLLEEMAAAAEDGKEVAYGLWGRVNAVFLGKKTAEVRLYVFGG